MTCVWFVTFFDNHKGLGLAQISNPALGYIMGSRKQSFHALFTVPCTKCHLPVDLNDMQPHTICLPGCSLVRS
ncbi:hypothetical protein AVEN_28848-1, partial [Araneus ventricosus]